MLSYTGEEVFMKSILIGLLLGVGAGILDVAPMILRKMNKFAVVSAFLQWVVLGFIITHIQFGVSGFLKGSIVAVACAIPIIAIVWEKEPKSSIPILLFSLVLGGLVGFAGDLMLK
jgi:uncharacterized membrane protein YhhN